MTREEKKITTARNHLAGEKSPYLLQHADNPVDWYPWGQEAFEKAKKEDKPVFLSIGYSTCHWCHVMEHESFENESIAKILNEHFVAVKVDREERPDIDHIYMKAVMMLTGSGGWPASLFLTPDQKPFAGGTYFPPESRWGHPGFKDILLKIDELWRDDRTRLLDVGQQITDSIASSSSSGEKAPLSDPAFRQAYEIFKQSFDREHGGFGTAPKFPSSHNLSFLLRYWKRSGELFPLEMVEKTLFEMANGGMYDHLGGGFHRYSTDRTWHVPHFEKMLYDQAMLSQTYLEAYQATGREFYAAVARETFEYVLRDLRDRHGGFYSAEDADSLPPESSNAPPDPTHKPEKKEGAFYLWTSEELNAVLGAGERDIIEFHYGVNEKGNISHDPHGEFGPGNILDPVGALSVTAARFSITEEKLKTILEAVRQKLFAVRGRRPRPHLDDKVLADWNGLMISALAAGSRVLNEPRYARAAEKAAQFILRNMMTPDGRLLHRFRDGVSGIEATIDDYAFFIHGLIDLYEATFNIFYLKSARDLTARMVEFFWDEQGGGFYFTASDAEPLLSRGKEIYDGAIPSGNSIAALDLIRLGRLTLTMEWEAKAVELFSAFGRTVQEHPQGYAQFLTALDFHLGPSREIVIAGAENDPVVQDALHLLYTEFLPRKVVMFRPGDDAQARPVIQIIPFIEAQGMIGGRTTFYVCENYQCKLPVNDFQEFKQQLGL